MLFVLITNCPEQHAIFTLIVGSHVAKALRRKSVYFWGTDLEKIGESAIAEGRKSLPTRGSGGAS